MGAYGYRGFFEQKPHFIESAKFAIKNLDWLLNNTKLPIEMPELYSRLKELVKETEKKPHPDFLTVEINSFSYKKSGIPKDTSGHGGGYVFDCRSLPNPGRHINYKVKTGLDKEVIDYFKDKKEMDIFIKNVYAIADQSVSNYLERKFDHLMFSFGCTGGQHRSVYNAQKLFDYLRDKYPIKVKVNHREQNITDLNFENE
jgi:RNase adaptor protein for sRNA GlmZ degradation